MAHAPVTARSTPLPGVALAWPARPASPRLAPNEVHIVAVALDTPDARTRRRAAALHDDERHRAERFRIAADRDRFLVGRTVLRDLLAELAGLPADAVAYTTGPHGKPALADHLGEELHFNMTHARGLALIAVTHAAPVGIDVEAIEEIPDLLDVANRFFAPAETAIIRDLSGRARVDAFFTCWTRKEAYIKALGRGLSEPLDQFTVSLRAGEAVQLLGCGAGDGPASDWTLRDLRPAPGFVGALAMRYPSPVVRCWRW